MGARFLGRVGIQARLTSPPWTRARGRAETVRSGLSAAGLRKRLIVLPF